MSIHPRIERDVVERALTLDFLTEARHFQQDGVPLETVETALLLGSLRRLIRPADAPRLSPIRSLAYFRPVIQELCDHPAPENYREYLRLKLRQVAKTLSADDRE
jgi:hypothetical protein